MCISVFPLPFYWRGGPPPLKNGTSRSQSRSKWTCWSDKTVGALHLKHPSCPSNQTALFSLCHLIFKYQCSRRVYTGRGSAANQIHRGVHLRGRFAPCSSRFGVWSILFNHKTGDKSTAVSLFNSLSAASALL